MQANLARTRQQQRARQGQGRNVPQGGRNLGVDAAADAARVPAIGAPNPIANDLGGPNPVPADNDAVQQLKAVITNLVLIFLVGFVEGHQKPIVDELVSILVKEPHDEVNIFSYVTCSRRQGLHYCLRWPAAIGDGCVGVSCCRHPVV